MTVLEISGVRKRFGGVVALAGVDVTIKSDEILGIIGPNGSGKTTLFNAVCGIYRPDAGEVRWDGADITGKPAFEIGRLGIGRTFQQAMSFPSLTVRENVQIAIEHGSARREGTTRHWSSPEELLSFVGLEGFADETANAMPFGNLRRLGIAVALGGRPSQLLLDEPAAGLNEGKRRTRSTVSPRPSARHRRMPHRPSRRDDGRTLPPSYGASFRQQNRRWSDRRGPSRCEGY